MLCRLTSQHLHEKVISQRSLESSTPLRLRLDCRPQWNREACRDRHCCCRVWEVYKSGEGAQNKRPSSSGRRALLAGILLSTASLGSGRASAATGQQTLEGGATVLVPTAETKMFSLNEKQVLEINRRVQKQNYVPKEFPLFVRTGFNIKVVADGYTVDDSGLIYKDFEEGRGGTPQDGQEVVFNYSAYNENGARIDSSFNKGRPAQTRLGIKGLIPGFEEGIKSMRVGGVRRLVVPPQLGPPVGPSTFFSAKQCEVFDVELVAVRSCRRRQVAMFSDVVCE